MSETTAWRDELSRMIAEYHAEGGPIGKDNPAAEAWILRFRDQLRQRPRTAGATLPKEIQTLLPLCRAAGLLVGDVPGWPATPETASNPAS